MAKSDQEIEPPEHTNQPPPAKAAWGTWEELLLAYAVNRYGTKSWDSISSELRKRSSDPIHFTPHHCEEKYGELKRRFKQSDENDVDLDDGVPWLEELRKLRVLELQRELRNYDLSITSLQLKVKKLTEENEKLDGETKRKADLGNKNDEKKLEQEDAVKNATPQPVVSGEVSGEEVSDRDNQSVNGSNGSGNEASPVATGGEKVEPAEVNGRPEGDEPVQTEPDGEASEAPESIAESKSEGKNSDVQSSAKMRLENEDQSSDSIPVRSLPLVDFLKKLKKLGSAVFELRLDRQEKIRYKNLIRQHIDYETLQTRLKEGRYSDGNDKFFRDLLLLITNTRIFFPKNSAESIAAGDLRQRILKEMITKKKQKTEPKTTNLPKQVTKSPDSLLLKPKLAAPIIVCRKRSSITAKAGRKEQPESKTDETPKKSQDSLPLIVKKKGKSPVTETSGAKPEKKNKLTEAEEKKQSATKFLNRIKRSNEPGLLLNTSKGSLDRVGSENDIKEDSRKSGGSKGGGDGDGKKDQSGKKSSGGRQVKEVSPARKSVGRPPKRAVVSGKRHRESVDLETELKETKKRSRR